MKIKKYIIVFTLLFIAMAPYAQEGNQDEGNSKREEIQRYFGYEKLLLRYYTAPYDVTMNVNERGNFLDIGFLFLMFLPVLFLLLYWKNTKTVILSILLMLLMLIVSTSNSFVYDSANVALIENNNGVLEGNPDLSFNVDPIGSLTESIYRFNNSVYAVINPVFENITGDKDHLTYPILLFLFGLFSYFLLNRMKGRELDYKHFLIVIVWFYSFLWFLLSAGIVWYGYLMLILGTLLIVALLEKLPMEFALNKFVKYSFYSLASIWIVMGFINRVSNINPATPNEHQGKGMYNPSFYAYSAGLRNEAQTIGTLYPYLDNAVQYMNKFEDKLVYRVGTSFTYFIENNNERVLIDNQLGFFSALIKKYPEKRALAKALHASDFKFIIIDLFTPTIDRTPERSLTKKYNLFMNFLHNNEHLRLIATDRMVKDTQNNGKAKVGVFGEVTSNGSYAIFEITK